MGLCGNFTLVLSQRTDTLQKKRVEIYSFAFRFKFLSLGVGAFPASSGFVAM